MTTIDNYISPLIPFMRSAKNNYQIWPATFEKNGQIFSLHYSKYTGEEFLEGQGLHVIQIYSENGTLAGYVVAEGIEYNVFFSLIDRKSGCSHNMAHQTMSQRYIGKPIATAPGFEHLEKDLVQGIVALVKSLSNSDVNGGKLFATGSVHYNEIGYRKGCEDEINFPPLK